MASNKHAQIRYKVLDECFSNFRRKFYFDDLMDRCNDALRELYGGEHTGIKTRTLRSDINYIRTKDYIFMPALSKNADCIEDTTVRRQFELRFPEYPKENIIPIYALEALKQEGGLHCCSWNILK